MTTKIKTKAGKLWGVSPSGAEMIYGKEVDKNIKKNYKIKNLNEVKK